MIEALERHGHLILEPEVKARLLTISPATVDRLLVDIRRLDQTQTRRGPKAGGWLKHQIPIRTFADWDKTGPGYLEADLVAHCGHNVGGSFLHTLVMTDVATQWTECFALLFRDQQTVLQAVQLARTQLPFELLGLDTDNGSEFLNYTLWLYCLGQSITFTRSRPYKKNDQCYVEQKNGSIVRRFVGYDRFEGLEACRILSQLYRYLRLYINFFQPSMKLIKKRRQGAKVKRKYDPAQTPYQRLLAVTSLCPETRQRLQQQFLALDPLALLHQIHKLQDQLWSYAYIKRQTSTQLASDNELLTTIQSPLQAISDVQVARNGKSGHNEAAPGLNGQPRTNGIDDGKAISPSARMYRHSKPKPRRRPAKRWWRTRKDPFKEVWPQAEAVLEQTPHLQAKTLFEMVCQRHPGQFSQGQLRTFQRRVKAWRTAYASRQFEMSDTDNINPISEVNHLPLR
jgi:hypothetical protein